MAEKNDKLKEIEKLSGEKKGDEEKTSEYLARIYKANKGINDELAKKAKELKSDHKKIHLKLCKLNMRMQRKAEQLQKKNFLLWKKI